MRPLSIKWGRMAVLVALALVLVLPWAVMADNAVADADVLRTGHQYLDLGDVCMGQAKTGKVYVYITREGMGNYFASAAAVDVSFVGATIGQVSTDALSASDGTIGLPENWVSASNGTASTPFTSTVTLSNPGSAGAHSASITFGASGQAGKGGTDGVLDLSCSVTVNWTTVTGGTCPPSDTTPPVITPRIEGTLGENGWYVSDVTVSWTVTDDESAISDSGGCDAVTINTDTAGTTLTCWATSAGGYSSQSVTIKRDATPPTITAGLTPAAASTGWYNIATGAPTVSFTCSDDTSGIPAGACPAAHTFGEGADQSWSASVSDAAGNSASAGVTNVDVDLTAPTITAALDKDPAPTGWYNISTGAPTVSFTCSDDTSGIPAGACPAAHTFGEGADQSYSASVSDAAGNSASAGVTGIDVDLTRPALNITGAASGSSTVCGSIPTRPTFAPADSGSGLASSDDSWTVPSTASGVGMYAYAAWAVDVAGNRAEEARSYVVTYGDAFSGYLQPINADNSSRFKLGSTVPVKFRLACGATPIANAVARLVVRQGLAVVDGPANEAVSTAAATTGNLFRYDPTAGQYIFNLSTKAGYVNPDGTLVAFAQGKWTLQIVLDDGSKASVTIELVK